MATVEGVLVDVPTIPTPVLDIAQDEEGYSAELSAERDLSAGEYNAISDACLRLGPVTQVNGQHEVRGLVSVDEDTLWVYVHQVGPGRFGPPEEQTARALLEQLWSAVHVAATSL